MKPAPAARNKVLLTSILLAVIIVVGVLFFRQRRRRTARPKKQVQDGKTTLPIKHKAELQLDGLSEAEAAERLVKVDLEALHEQENKDFTRRALRQAPAFMGSTGGSTVAERMALANGPEPPPKPSPPADTTTTTCLSFRSGAR